MSDKKNGKSINPLKFLMGEGGKKLIENASAVFDAQSKTALAEFVLIELIARKIINDTEVDEVLQFFNVDINKMIDQQDRLKFLIEG